MSLAPHPRASRFCRICLIWPGCFSSPFHSQRPKSVSCCSSVAPLIILNTFARPSYSMPLMPRPPRGSRIALEPSTCRLSIENAPRGSRNLSGTSKACPSTTGERIPSNSLPCRGSQASPSILIPPSLLFLSPSSRSSATFSTRNFFNPLIDATPSDALTTSVKLEPDKPR